MLPSSGAQMPTNGYLLLPCLLLQYLCAQAVTSPSSPSRLSRDNDCWLYHSSSTTAEMFCVGMSKVDRSLGQCFPSGITRQPDLLDLRPSPILSH